jgi:membrane-associated phospholipid phosphatase
LHFPADVLGGALLGILIALVTVTFTQRYLALPTATF